MGKRGENVRVTSDSERAIEWERRIDGGRSTAFIFLEGSLVFWPSHRWKIYDD